MVYLKLKTVNFFMFCTLNFLYNIPYDIILFHNEKLTPANAFSSPERIFSEQGIISLQKANANLRNYLVANDISKARLLIDSLTLIIDKYRFDSIGLADFHYYKGIFYSSTGRNEAAIAFYYRSNEIREKTGETASVLYSNSLFNIGVAYNKIGDFKKSINHFHASVENDKKLYGVNSIKVIEGYLWLSASCTEIRNFDEAAEYVNIALTIASNNPGSVSKKMFSSLYIAKGVIYSFMADYSQARNNFEKAEYFYSDNLLDPDLDYIDLLDNLATAYHFLGLKNKSYEYYRKGIRLASADFSALTSNLVNNYSIILGNDGLTGEGEALLANALLMEKQRPDGDLRKYYIVLRNYAEYLREYKIDTKKALQLYSECFGYIGGHTWDKDLKIDILTGYSLTLLQNGENERAIDTIQSLLFSETNIPEPGDHFLNPPRDSVKADKRSLKILDAKYRIVLDTYRKTQDLKMLECAAYTSELIIGILEKIRLNISEEESRLLLGDKYRESYLNAINCFAAIYEKTDNPVFLGKAFELTEKSKVAGLLAATREMRAIQFHIPAGMALFEKDLQRQIGFYNAKISEEQNSLKPDKEKIRLWSDYILTATFKRDSLIELFEESYPEYYKLKYNTAVVAINDIPGMTGKNQNFLSFVLSDSSLFIFVINKKYKQLCSKKIDSSFFNTISRFRSLLSNPQMSHDAKKEFGLYQSDGYYLYTRLIEPVKEYLISDELIISPDNILSYIPFETFISENMRREDILFRELPYLMNDFKISYTYSATLLSESAPKRPSLRNSALAFAPSYRSQINIDSLLCNRQTGSRILRDLPFAREEAKFVSEKSGGRLFLNDNATKSAFCSGAGRFDIIHLAMHTILNDAEPLYSKMVFTAASDSIGAGSLNTYEIYSIPLQAKMVVLSSCNTGAGTLHKGEGILSLARGFIYAGSRSVVMSLWEVEDRTGTEIIKSFYTNLKRGCSKSSALQKSRIKYLKTADQLRSHPYFWSTLVVYGDNSPLYYPFLTKFLFISVLSALILAPVVCYIRRKCS